MLSMPYTAGKYDQCPKNDTKAEDLFEHHEIIFWREIYEAEEVKMAVDSGSRNFCGREIWIELKQSKAK